MLRRLHHILIAVLGATALVLQPVSAGVFSCANCCESQADKSCCQSADQVACCSNRAAACCEMVRSSCCGETQRPAGCHCAESRELPAETPLPEPSTADGVIESFAALSLTTWDGTVLHPHLERVAFERSPLALHAPPALQLMLCVWRT